MLPAEDTWLKPAKPMRLRSSDAAMQGVRKDQQMQELRAPGWLRHNDVAKEATRLRSISRNRTTCRPRKNDVRADSIAIEQEALVPVIK